jgi:diguanylate cyclase (GGDEF)-like protein/PAS domain S-box-containing protein
MSTPQHATRGSERVNEARHAEPSEAPLRTSFDRLARLARRTLDTSLAVIAFSPIDELHVPSSVSVSADGVTARCTPMGDMLVTTVTDHGQPLRISDVLENEFPCSPSESGEPDIRSFLGVPVNLRCGTRAGAFCVADHTPREWLDEDLETLSDLAESISAELELCRVSRKVKDFANDGDAELAVKATVLDSALDSIITIDHERRVIEFNPAAERTFGYTRDAVIGKPIEDLIVPPEFRKHCREGLVRHLATGESSLIGKQIELLAARADGSIIQTEMAITRTDLPGREQPIFTAYLRDITERKRAEQDVRFYKHIADSVGQAVVANDNSPDRRITYWNAAAEKLFGWSADEVIGKDVRTIVPSDEMLLDVEKIGEKVRTGETWAGAFTLRHRGGSSIPALGSVAPVWGESGDVIGVIGSFTDISELKAAEENLRFHKHMADAVGQAVVVSDVAGRITYWNRAAEHLYGWTAEEAIGQFVYELLPADGGEQAAVDITELLAGGSSWSGEFTVRRRDGSEFEAYFTDAPIFGEDGTIIGIIGVSHDISERKAYEQQIRFHKLLLDAVGQAVMATDQQLRITYWNRAAEELYGWKAGEVVGTNLLDLMPPQSAGMFQAVNAIEALSRVGGWSGEMVNYHRDGREIAVLANAAPIVNDAGEQVGLIAALADITMRKRTEEALRESNDRVIQLLETMGDGFISLDRDWNMTYVNRQAEHILRRGRQELIGRNLWREYPESEDKPFLTKFDEAFKTGQAVSVTAFDPDLAMWLECHAYPSDESLSVFFRNVTQRHEAEIALRNAEERYRSLVEQLPATTYISSAEDANRLVYVSPQIEKVAGYTPEEWIADPHRWIEFVHPDDRERAWEDGHIDPENPDSQTLEYRVKIKSGEYRWVRDTLTLVRDEEGNPKYWQGIAFDITAEKDAERALQESEERFRTLVEQLPAATYISSPHDVSEVLYVSPQITDLHGYTPEEWLSNPGFWLRSVHPEDLPVVEEQDRISNETGQPFVMEYRARKKDGDYIWIREMGRLIYGDDGEPRYWQGFSFDVTSEKNAERSIRESEQRFRSLFDNHPDAVFSIDKSGYVLTANRAFLTTTGWTTDMVGDRRFVDLVVPDDRERVHQRFDQSHRGEAQEFHAAITSDRGERTLLSITSIPIIVDEEIVGVHVAAQDITVHQELENQLAHQAYHDSLTGLPNRNLFQNRLERRLAEARKRNDQFAVLFFDLDDFKVINDSLGHSAGDQLLVQAATRVRACIRDNDLLARLGGDEFTLLLERIHDVDDAVILSKRIASVLDDSFDIGGHEVFVTTSIGIALGDDSYEEPDEILRNADLAMYAAKNSGKNRYALFKPSMKSQAWLRLTLETEIRRAISRDEFVVYYQPIVNLSSGDLIGVEALIRWNHPERGLLSPDEFMSVAEQSALILPLGRWTIERAIAQVRTWHETLPADHHFRLSLNLSSKQYQHPRLIQELSETLERVQLDPTLITLEITESIAMDESLSTTETLARLKEVGVQLALDDFGTGFSALSYLRRFPIDIIKIDQSFVDGLGTDPEDTSIVEAVMAASHAMGLHVTAEGIETTEQLQLLQSLGCHSGQGYLFARPLPAEDIQKLIEHGERLWSSDVAAHFD